MKRGSGGKQGRILCCRCEALLYTFKYDSRYEQGQCSQFTRRVWVENERNSFVYEISWSMNKGSILSGQDLSFFGMKKGSVLSSQGVCGWNMKGTLLVTKLVGR